MGTKISSSLSKIQKRLEGIRAKCTNDSGNDGEILFDALDQLQDISSKLSIANDKLKAEIEELKQAEEERERLLSQVVEESERLQAIMGSMDEEMWISGTADNIIQLRNS